MSIKAPPSNASLGAEEVVNKLPSLIEKSPNPLLFQLTVLFAEIVKEKPSPGASAAFELVKPIAVSVQNKLNFNTRRIPVLSEPLQSVVFERILLLVFLDT